MEGTDVDETTDGELNRSKNIKTRVQLHKVIALQVFYFHVMGGKGEEEGVRGE